MVNPFALSLIVALQIPTPLEAKDFGTQGAIYPITEEDPIALIHQKLKAIGERGELAQHHKELQQKTKAVVERPTPLKGITKASESRVFYFDPSYVVQEDLRDPTGKLFAKKGTKINPLKTVSLSQNLLFFDGDDVEQKTWVEGRIKTDPLKPTKLILTKGAPLALSQELEMPVYFDQAGVLTKKLGIRCVPAEVRQEGYFLRIEEITLSRTPQ